jgi:hypothetical protein
VFASYAGCKQSSESWNALRVHPEVRRRGKWPADVLSGFLVLWLVC